MTHKEATLSMKHAHGTPLMIALVAFASLTAISGKFVLFIMI